MRGQPLLPNSRRSRCFARLGVVALAVGAVSCAAGDETERGAGIVSGGRESGATAPGLGASQGGGGSGPAGPSAVAKSDPVVQGGGSAGGGGQPKIGRAHV